MHFIFLNLYPIDQDKKFFALKSTKQIYKALLSKDCHLVGVVEGDLYIVRQYIKKLRGGNYEIN